MLHEVTARLGPGEVVLLSKLLWPIGCQFLKRRDHLSHLRSQRTGFSARWSQSCISPLSSTRLQFHFLLEAFQAHRAVLGVSYNANASSSVPACMLKETCKAHGRMKRNLYASLKPQSHPHGFPPSSFRVLL